MDELPGPMVTIRQPGQDKAFERRFVIVELSEPTEDPSCAAAEPLHSYGLVIV